MRRNLLKTVILSGLALLIAAIAGAEFTSRPSFCRSCHEMQPMYDAWQTSAHREVACLRCHADPGVVGLARAKINGLGEVYYHFARAYQQPIRITTETKGFSARCLSCHEKTWEQARAETGPHNPSHRQIGLPCTRCHQPLVHDPQRNTTTPPRQVCVGCHGTTNPGGKS